MNIARASIEVQVIIAIGAVFGLMVVLALINFWHATDVGDTPLRRSADSSDRK